MDILEQFEEIGEQDVELKAVMEGSFSIFKQMLAMFR